MSKIKCFLLEDTRRMTKYRVIRNELGKKTGKSRDRIFRNPETGEEFEGLSQVPAGAMWFADWYGDQFNPQLGQSLFVRTPNGDWHVDGQSSNCGMKEDYYQQNHHCWVITGEMPNITVGKNGKTCQAGAGSIQIGSYHGFLRNGYLEKC